MDVASEDCRALHGLHEADVAPQTCWTFAWSEGFGDSYDKTRIFGALFWGPPILWKLLHVVTECYGSA